MIRRRKRKPRYIPIFIALSLIIGLIYVTLSFILTPRDKWVSLKESFVSVSTQHKALIVFKEVVYKSLNTGFLEKPEEEGKKVKKGQIIGSLVATRDASEESVSMLDKKEEEKEDEATEEEEDGLESGEEEGEKLSKEDEKKKEEVKTPTQTNIETDARTTFHNLNQAIKDKDTSLALRLKRELQYKLNTLAKSENTGAQAVLENERFIGSATAKEGEKFSVISSESGQLSYFIDEFSGKLHIEQCYDFDYDRLFNTEIPSKNMMNAEFKRSDSVFKIISPSKWHLICELTMEDMEGFSSSEKVTVIIEGKELKGEVLDEFVINNRALVLIEMREPLNLVNETRKTNVTVVHDRIAALVIPFNALSSEDRQQGVYVKGINGEKVFRPIDIKHTNEDGYVVTSGSYTIKDKDGSLKTIDTVTSQDQVLIQDKH